MRGLAAAVVVGSVLLAACEPAPDTESLRPPDPVSTPTSTDTRVIGLVGTLSGPNAVWGQDAFEGAQLAVHELNRAVAEGRPEFELVTRDDAGNAPLAQQLVAEFAALDRTVGVIYAGPPEVLPAAEAALTQAGIPAILCYGDLYSARQLRPHIFQASPPFLWQARAMARYMERDRGYTRIGVLADRSQSGATAVVSLRTALSEQGLGLRAVARYTAPSEFERLLRRFRQRRVEAVVIQGASGQPMSELLQLMRQSDRDYLTTAKAKRPRGAWHPQIFGFDMAMHEGTITTGSGTVAAESYARGPHLLPIPSMERFRQAFTEWWAGEEPLGWELRAYDAAQLIGWASTNSRPGTDLALVLEQLRKKRFGGITITLGPDDHTTVEQATVGLWVLPRRSFEAPLGLLPWLPLGRGFSIDGERTAVANEDWRYLFRNPPPPNGPAPRVTRMRFAVNSPSSDPVH